MRVLFLNDLHDPRIGSSVRQMFQLAERLRELGHETLLVTATQDRALATPTVIEGLDTERLHSDYNPRFRAWVALSNPRVRRSLSAILERWRPDVVHSHLLHTHLSYAALTEARRRGAGVVFTAHDAMTFCYQKMTCFHGGEAHGGELRDYRAYWQKCIPCQRLRYRPGRNQRIRAILERDVHRLTAVSDELAKVLRTNDIEVHRTIYNAIRPQLVPPTAEQVALFRARFGLTGKQVVAIGGRLHEQKGVVQLLKMLSTLSAELPDVRLLVMGRREIYDGEFAPVARDLKVEDRVVATDWLDGNDLQCAYACADVFVTPSICFDTFALVNVEAMEHKKPVVATAFGGSPEVVEDGRTGFVANPFDIEGFAGRIRLLLQDRELAVRMGEAGHQRMLAHFTVERLAGEFLEEYETAVDLVKSVPAEAQAPL